MAIYFVDKHHPNASDLNPGTENLPWKTSLRASFAPEVSGGDTVYFKEGFYFENFPKGISGTPGQPIIFEAYKDHNVVFQTTPVFKASNFNWPLKKWFFEPQFYSVTNCSEIVSPSVIRIDFNFNPFYNGNFVYIPCLSSYANFYSSTEIEKNNTIFRVLSSNDTSIIINIGRHSGPTSFVSTILADGKVAQPAVKIELDRNLDLANDYREFNHHLNPMINCYGRPQSTGTPESSTFRACMYLNGVINYTNTTVTSTGWWPGLQVPTPDSAADIGLIGFHDCYYNDFIMIHSFSSNNSFNVGIDRSGNTLFAPISNLYVNFEDNIKKINGKQFTNWRVLSANQRFAWVETFFTPGVTGSSVPAFSGLKLYNSWYVHDPYRDKNLPVLSGGEFNFEQRVIPDKASCYKNPKLKNKGYWALRYRNTLHGSPPFNYNIFNFNGNGNSSTQLNTSNIRSASRPIMLPGAYDRMWLRGEGYQDDLLAWSKEYFLDFNNSNSSANFKTFPIRLKNRLDLGTPSISGASNFLNFSALQVLLIQSGKTGKREPDWPNVGVPFQGGADYSSIYAIPRYKEFYTEPVCTVSDGLSAKWLTAFTPNFGQPGDRLIINNTQNLVQQGNLANANSNGASSWVKVWSWQDNIRQQVGCLDPLSNGSIEINSYFFGPKSQTMYFNLGDEHNLNIFDKNANLNCISSPYFYSKMNNTLVFTASGTADNKLEIIAVNSLVNEQSNFKSYDMTHIFRTGVTFTPTILFYGENFQGIDNNGNRVAFNPQTEFTVISSYYDSNRFNTIVDFYAEGNVKIDITRLSVLRFWVNTCNVKFRKFKYQFGVIEATGKNNEWDNCISQGHCFVGAQNVVDGCKVNNCISVDMTDSFSPFNTPTIGKYNYNNILTEKGDKIMLKGADSLNKCVGSYRVNVKNSVYNKHRAFAQWFDGNNRNLKFIDNYFINNGYGLFFEISDNLIPKWPQWRPESVFFFDGIASNLPAPQIVKVGSEFYLNNRINWTNIQIDNEIYNRYSSKHEFFLRAKFPYPNSGFTSLKIKNRTLLRAISAHNYGICKPAPALTNVQIITAQSGSLNPFNNIGDVPTSFYYPVTSVLNPYNQKVFFDGNIYWIAEGGVENAVNGGNLVDSEIFDSRENQLQEKVFEQSCANNDLANCSVGNYFSNDGTGGEWSSTNNILSHNNTTVNNKYAYARMYDRGNKANIKNNVNLQQMLATDYCSWMYNSINHIFANNLYSIQYINNTSEGHGPLAWNPSLSSYIYFSGITYGENNIRDNPMMWQNQSFPPYYNRYFNGSLYNGIMTVDLVKYRTNNWYYSDSFTYETDRNGWMNSGFRVLSTLNVSVLNINATKYPLMSSDYNVFDVAGGLTPCNRINFNEGHTLSAFSYIVAAGGEDNTVSYDVGPIPFNKPAADWVGKVPMPKYITGIGKNAPELNTKLVPIQNKIYRKGMHLFRELNLSGADIRSLSNNYATPFSNLQGSTLGYAFDTGNIVIHNSLNNYTIKNIVYIGSIIEINKLPSLTGVIAISKLSEDGTFNFSLWNWQNRNSSNLKYLENGQTYTFCVSSTIELKGESIINDMINVTYNMGY